jgi:hypothetical protein
MVAWAHARGMRQVELNVLWLLCCFVAVWYRRGLIHLLLVDAATVLLFNLLSGDRKRSKRRITASLLVEYPSYQSG